ncbi:MAG: hypothetical protein MJZ21_06530 [archaeon]|nr:hypothetical protein [archaeon]
MASSLDRSTRGAKQKKKEESERKRSEKQSARTDTRTRKEVKKKNVRNSAARFESRSMLRTMAVSSGILIIAFIVFEGLLILFKSMAGEGYSNRDEYWHLINIADTCVGFLIGIIAMDALTYFNDSNRSKRDEARAIIRHNRIIKPYIEMFLARKNALMTADEKVPKYFDVVSGGTLYDLKDMYSSSKLGTDAEKPKIVVFEFYLKKLNTAFLNMAEDINFDYNPELCDAIMSFLNETIYGQASTEALIAYGIEGNRAQKMSVIRKIKEADPDTQIGSVEGELNTVLIFKRMVEQQEKAIKQYNYLIEVIDPENKVSRHGKIH